jgi:hypothetical protein
MAAPSEMPTSMGRGWECVYRLAQGRPVWLRRAPCGLTLVLNDHRHAPKVANQVLRTYAAGSPCGGKQEFRVRAVDQGR